MGIITGLTAARMLAIEAASVVSGAISGDNLILTKHDGSTINAGNVRGPLGYPGIGKNKIINGDFSVNQRAFTSISGAWGYGFDRWYFGYSGASPSCSAIDMTLGAIPGSAVKHVRLNSSTQSAATDYTQLIQYVEDVRTLSGKSVVFSFWAKAASGTPSVAVNLQQYFGTGGSPSAFVSTVLGKVQISTTWARYTLVGTLPSLTGKTLGTANDSRLEVHIWTSAGSNHNSFTSSLGAQQAIIDIWGVQLEEGSTVTAYEQKTYAQELRDCQRYYEERYCGMNTGNNLLAVVYYSQEPLVAQWEYKVPKARVPNIIFPTNGAARYAGSNQWTGNLTVSSAAVSDIACTLTVPGSYAGGAGWIDEFKVAANAEYTP